MFEPFYFIGFLLLLAEFVKFLRGGYSLNSGVAEGGTISGARSTDDLITTRRKYDFSDKIVWKEKTWAPFLTILTRRMAKYKVTDPEPKIMQDGYTPIIFTLNNAAGTTSTFEFTDAIAALLQPDDVLMIVETDDYTTNEAEYALVTAVGAAGSGPAGSGYTAVTVSRAYEGGSAKNIATAANFRVISSGITFAEGTGVGESKNQEVTTDYNYTEILKDAYEVTGTFDKTNYYGPVDMQYKARKARMDFMRRLEYKLFFGRRFKKTVAGKPKRFFGGIREHIIDNPHTGVAAGNLLDFSNSATPTTWNSKAESIFKVGSDRKTVFAGPGLITLVDNAFSSAASVYTKNEQLSREYLVEVQTLKTSHGYLDFVREQAFADLPIWTKTGYVVDLPYYYYMYMSGRDIQILKNVQTNDKDTMKNAIFGEIGLHRSFGESSFFIYNLD